jgi:hypothetical protein
MERLTWICSYCGSTFSHQPTYADDGKPCCSTGCANYLNSEQANKPPLINLPHFGKKKKSA